MLYELLECRPNEEIVNYVKVASVAKLKELVEYDMGLSPEVEQTIIARDIPEINELLKNR